MNRYFFGILGVACAVSLVGCTKQESKPQPRVPKVFVAKPKVARVADYEDFIGTTDAVDKVDVRARVSGYLVKVAFKDGEHVEKNQLLYQIDPRPFEADLKRAEGEVVRLDAQKKEADIQVERYRKLAEKGAGSQQDLDQYRAQQGALVGQLQMAHAQVDQAKLNLEFTTIRSPIAGKVSRTYFTEGNLINADMTLLTTVMSIDPIYAYFDVEEPTFQAVQELVRKGVIKATKEALPVHMRLSSDPPDHFPITGVLDFTNNTVNPQTGTIQVRGRFDNPYDLTNKIPPLLMPGYSVRVRLEESMPHDAVLITERAVGTDQGSKYVFVVDKNKQVVYRPVELGMVFGGLQEVKKGLKPGELVVVNGLQRIRRDILVDPTEVEMTPAGDVNAEKAAQMLLEQSHRKKEAKLKAQEQELHKEKETKTQKKEVKVKNEK